MSTQREVIEAKDYAVSSGHELATRAGMDILQSGGNAVEGGGAPRRAQGGPGSNDPNTRRLLPGYSMQKALSLLPSGSRK